MPVLRTAHGPNEVATPAGAAAPARPDAQPQQADLKAKVAKSLRVVRDRAVWVGVAAFLAMEAAGEISRMRRHFHRSVDDWEIDTVNRAKREMRGEGVAALARLVSRPG